MTINYNNGLVGLAILGGTSAYTSALSTSSSTESAAVLKAKSAFTLPATTPPWEGSTDTSSTNAQVLAIEKMRTIIDDYSKVNSLEDLPDVQTAFTSYKALDRLRVLAEAATKSYLSTSERAALQKSFAKGLSDLKDFLGSAKSDQLTLAFNQTSRSAQTVGITTSNLFDPVVGSGVSTSRTAAIDGLAGNEVFEVTLTKGSTTEKVSVNLAQTTQPPTLDSVAAALNAAIGATQTVDSSGNSVSAWKSNFTVEKNNGKWGLVFNPSGLEKVSIDQVGAGNALMVASGATIKTTSATSAVTTTSTTARVYRFEDLEGALSWERLGSITAVNGTATAQAKAAASSSDNTDTNYTVYANTDARGIVTDAQGNSYVVGTTDGNVGSALSDGANDLFLTKVDSEGKVVWQRSLGAAGSAEGAAISIAPNGDIVVAGTVSGAFSESDDSQTDMLVSRFSATGTELSSTAIRKAGNETASAVTVGDDGSIYVAGRSSTGGGDAFIVKLDSTGKVSQQRTIDSGGIDTVSALAIDGSGNLLALTSENGSTKLRQIDSSSLSTDLGSITLGNASARAISVSDTGEIAIVGTTSAALQGDQVNTLSGGQDAFVTRIDSALSSASTTYIGTAETDQADSVAWLDGKLYVGGRTAGALSGDRSGTVDGFVARIDTATGAVETVSQWGVKSTAIEPVRISLATGGATALGALGLSRGTLNQQSSTTLVSQTALRAGDQFTVNVDSGSTRTITIEANETMTSLAQKIQKITGTKATITTPRVDGELTLKITVQAGHTLELGGGASGKDALTKLGIDPVRLVASETKSKDAAKVTPGGKFNLQLTTALNLEAPAAATAALKAIESAISVTQTGYRSLYWDSTKASLVDGTTSSSGGSAYQQKQLANYQAALSRLTSSS